ncbi:ribosome biogenesis GTPase YlqF [Thiomicrospira sp. WB1]|uniref:ribosome biogenesis GTPase YlqF n=1 Tax=Thiomicrospira sp. WB1 TaxID=1685380 RepID=UPI0007465C3A|nr:ribosome biogenesis GTPase YlqF [Thiomicrospira sp. WB1]KUJ72165.1 ribosome biogenesis GTPase YlqF [Thiomicrospira sp. WB1]
MLNPIQWYPGHMHKAQKEVREQLPEIDLVIEVLDARIPYSSQNPMLAQLYGDRPVIKLFNKSDLADPALTERWQAYYQPDKSVRTLPVNSKDTQIRTKLLQQIEALLPLPDNSVKKRRLLILGIPNVGKSTLINTLCERTIAKTGNEPAVTRLIQRIQLNARNTLFDTPGMLWPNIDNAHSGYRLAITGGIKETAFELPDIATYASEYLLNTYPERLMARFSLSELPNHTPYPDLEVLEQIGRQRGCLVSGGQVDLDKASRILISELREGLLGPITWETPEMMQQEKAEVEQIREEKAAKKAARKEARDARKRQRKKNR